MKMTKQVKAMVAAANEYLRENHVKSTGEDMFIFMGYFLEKAGCYHGFNYFTVDGKLSGGVNEHFDHLEFYIV